MQTLVQLLLLGLRGAGASESWSRSIAGVDHTRGVAKLGCRPSPSAGVPHRKPTRRSGAPEDARYVLPWGRMTLCTPWTAESPSGLTVPIMGTNIPSLGISMARQAKSARTRPRARGRSNGEALGLADALFTRTQQRLFALLFGQPDRTFLATALMRLADVGRGTVQRELKRLVDTGLVTASRLANQRHLKANPDSPIFDELVRIVGKTIGLAEPVRDALLKAGDGIRLAIIYGSVARRTDTAASDIDLLIVSDTLTLEEVYELIDPVERQLGRKISPIVLTSQEFRRRRRRENRFLSRALAGEHLVLIGTVDDA